MYHIEAWSGKGVVRNYADPNRVSVDPMPVYWNRTIATAPSNFTANLYDFSKYIPDAVVINLGTNDFSTHPWPEPSVFMDGYKNLIATIRMSYNNQMLPIFVACGPMIGDPCCSYVKSVAASFNGVYFIDLQNILGPDEIGCGGHPNVLGHIKMAAIAAPVIGSVLNW